MKEVEARNEWDLALTKVLLDNMGVNVRKLSDFMYAVAYEKDPTINTIVQAAGLVDLSAVGQVNKIATSHYHAQEGCSRNRVLTAQGRR